MNAAPLAIRARTNGLMAAGVEQARVRERSVVRTWAMRSTLHLVASDDLGWLLGLLGPGFAAAGKRRRAQLGLDEAASTRGVRIIRDAIVQCGPLTRAEVAERLAAHALPATGQAPIHLIALAAMQGIVCLGPDHGKKPTYALLDDWVKPGATLPREQALMELARRYLAAHAPATVEDYAAWSGLPLGEARTAWRELSTELLDVEMEQAGPGGDSKGGTLQIVRAQSPWLDALSDGRTTVRLLPSFDPYLLGYRNRALAVPPEHAKRIHPGGGIIHPALVVNGQTAGSWRIKRSPKKLEVVVAPFGKLTDEVVNGLEAEVADIGRFLGLPATWSTESSRM